MKAGVAEVKARLSAYLEHVKAGQELLITERGVPIAKVVPLDREARRRSRRERLAKFGTLRLGRGRVRKILRLPPKGAKVGEGVLRALLAEPDEGR